MSRLPSIATGKSHHLPNGSKVQSLPGTPTEGNQQDSNNGAAGGSRKSPSTMMRPRSTQVLLPETLRYVCVCVLCTLEIAGSVSGKLLTSDALPKCHSCLGSTASIDVGCTARDSVHTISRSLTSDHRSISWPCQTSGILLLDKSQTLQCAKQFARQFVAKR